MTAVRHIPAYAAQGLRGAALCHRTATYRTGDHDLIRRHATAAIVEGDTTGLCARCVAWWRWLADLPVAQKEKSSAAPSRS